MKFDLGVLAFLFFNSVIIASAQVTATAPSVSMHEGTRPQGTIQLADPATKTFAIGEATPPFLIRYTDETAFFLHRPDQKVAHLNSGDTVQVFGYVWFTKAGIETLAIRLFKIKEGMRGPKGEIGKKSVTGTFKQEGDAMWILVQTEEGEKALAMNPKPTGTDEIMVMESVPAEEALQKGAIALFKGKPQDDGFLATEVQVRFAKPPAKAEEGTTDAP